MIGKGHSGALVTVVERVTQFTLVANVPDKSAEEVTAVTIALLKPYKRVLHTITADNGKEFAYHKTQMGYYANTGPRALTSDKSRMMRSWRL